MKQMNIKRNAKSEHLKRLKANSHIAEIILKDNLNKTNQISFGLEILLQFLLKIIIYLSILLKMPSR